MPLVKQNIDLIFTGLDTKGDPKNLPIGNLTRLENAVYRSKDSIVKRNGYVSLGTSVIGSASPLSAIALGTFQSELLSLGATLNSYVPSTDQWVERGRLNNFVLSETPASSSTLDCSNADSAANGKYRLTAWCESDSSSTAIKCSVVELETGAVLLQTTVSSSATAKMPLCLCIRENLIVTYVDSTDLKSRLVKVTDSAVTLEAAVTVQSGLPASGQLYDVCAQADYGFFACNQNTSGIKLGFLAPTGAAGSVANGFLAPVSIAETPSNSIALNSDLTKGLIWVAHSWQDTGVEKINLLFYKIVDLTSAYTKKTLDTAPGAAVKHLTLAWDGSLVNCIGEVYNATSTNTSLRYNTSTFDGATLGTATTLQRGVGLASKAFLYGTETLVWVCRASTLQNTLFLYDVARQRAVGREFIGIAGGIRSQATLPQVVVKGNDYSAAFEKQGRVTLENGYINTLRSISIVNAAANSPLTFQNEQLGENLHLSSSLPQIYEGLHTVEQGFNWYPETLSGTASNSTGALTSAKTYQYCVVFEWVDSRGQVHQSAPSTPLTVTTGASDNTITLTIETLRLTDKENVGIAIYRTAGNGSLFYRVNSYLSPLLNNKAANSVSYTDGLSDNSLVAGQLLYTTGGVLEALPAPAMRNLEVVKNRVFCLSNADNCLFYSHEWLPGEAVEFHPELYIKVERQGGRLEAIKAMDNKVILFKRDRIYFLAGDGPNRLGQGAFSEPELITADVGCSTPNSIVMTPNGLMFDSAKGKYLLSRSLQVAYVGEAVERWNGIEVSAAILQSDVNEVRFSLTTGEALVFNYLYGKWSVFTGLNAVDAISWQGSNYILNSSNKVLEESASAYTDDGKPIHLLAETSWIHLNGLSGLQRIRKFAFLGTYLSAHKLLTSVAYDYSDAYQEHYLFHADVEIAASPFGTSVFGAETPFGGDYQSAYMFRASLSRQKCTAIRFCISDLFSIPGAGFSMTGLTLEAAGKQGLKNSATRTIGSSN